MLVLDSSALFKRYLDESGRSLVLTEMSADEEWCASALCLVETRIALCRATDEPVRAHAALDADWARFIVVPLAHDCLARAADIGCAHRVTTADAIHLASADLLPMRFRFLTFDRRQAVAARDLGFTIVDVDASG